MKNPTEQITWRPINFRTFATVLPEAYKNGFELASLSELVTRFQGESQGDLERLIHEYSLDQHRNWGVFEGTGALVAFANQIEATPLIDVENPFLPAIQNAPATLVLRRKVQDGQLIADSVNVATTVSSRNGSPRILAASYEAHTGDLNRVNVSTGRYISHQGIKTVPTRPESFISQAGFVTARMVAETGHRNLADILHSPSYGIGIVGDLNDRVSQELGLSLRSDENIFSIDIENTGVSVPKHI